MSQTTETTNNIIMNCTYKGRATARSFISSLGARKFGTFDWVTAQRFYLVCVSSSLDAVILLLTSCLNEGRI
jgi:hypothetical protein